MIVNRSSPTRHADLLHVALAAFGAVLMLVLRQPMRVAIALISTMVLLGGIYGLSACTSSPRSRC